MVRSRPLFNRFNQGEPMRTSRPQPITPLTLLLLILFSSHPLMAKEAPPGWRWYNEPKPIKQNSKPKPKPLPPNTVTRVMSATEQMDWFHKEYDEVKNDTVINPKNKEKLAKLLTLHHYITDQTDQIGMTFKALLLEQPEFSYTKDHPTEQAARQTYLTLETAKKEAAINTLVDEGWGFFFVYEGKDTLSNSLAPSMQSFADKYHIELLGLSNDGAFISSIRENKANQGKVTVPFTPALILVHPKTKAFKPLAYGFISQQDLLGRFYNVATDYQSDF